MIRRWDSYLQGAKRIQVQFAFICLEQNPFSLMRRTCWPSRRFRTRSPIQKREYAEYQQHNNEQYFFSRERRIMLENAAAFIYRG